MGEIFPALAVLAAAAARGAEAWGVDGSSDVWETIRANRDNQTALHTVAAPPWVSAAEFRGTMAILQTCVLTLFACVYTALHLNVPPRTDWLSLLATKAKWVVMALLAPEIVLFMAADQLIQALRLRRELRALQESSDRVDKDHFDKEPLTYLAQFDFDLRYAFLVVMGGVVLDPAALAKFDLFLADGKSGRGWPLHLSPDGVIFLARRDCWIYVKPERIAAKSKADVLQKVLVLLQVSYAATSCVVRRVYGLPLALLEVHTMVHVVCAVAMYALWFKKPLDISEAEQVYDPEWHNAIGAMVQAAYFEEENAHIEVQRAATKELPDGQPLPSQPTGDELISPPVSSAQHSPPGHPATSCIRVGNWIFFVEGNPSHSQFDPDPLRSGTMERWTAVASDLDSHWTRQRGRATGRFRDSHKVDGMGKMRLIDLLGLCGELRLSETRNLHFSYSDALVSLSTMLNAMRLEPSLVLLDVVLPAVYGGVHLGAWDFDFPTPAEHLLWKIMCLVIAGAVPAMIGMVVVWAMFLAVLVRCEGPLRGSLYDLLRTILRGCYSCTWFVFLAAYVCARLYIVVESFLSLRRVPIGVYYTPSWLQMIPHA